MGKSNDFRRSKNRCEAISHTFGGARSATAKKRHRSWRCGRELGHDGDHEHIHARHIWSQEFDVLINDSIHSTPYKEKFPIELHDYMENKFGSWDKNSIKSIKGTNGC